jgi:hypothetical protein
VDLAVGNLAIKEEQEAEGCGAAPIDAHKGSVPVQLEMEKAFCR